MWAWFILAGLVGFGVYGWAIIIDGAQRARAQEKAVDRWLIEQGEAPIYGRDTE